ncbi:MULTISPECIES: MFS transporter [Actinomycetes]|uniref:Major facilitator superfamily (MFS) profile domain-containing protein n=2 Tax=Actinomycetes TaxID=1760 RepID=A0ABP6LZ46_9MICC
MTPHAPAETTLESPRRLAAILLLFAAVMLVGGTDMTKVVVALPELTADVSLDPAGSVWVADIYPLAAGAVLMTSAVLADRLGRRRLYLSGLVVAVLSAALVGFSSTGAAVIAGRIGQGVGAALLIAGTVAIIRVTFPGGRLRALAYGVWVVGFSAGSALGPLVGGVLVDLAGWRWVFWVNVPVLGLCLVAAVVVLRESRNSDPPRLDGLSIVSSMAAVGLLVVGMKTLARPESPAWASVAALLGGVLLAVVFVGRQLRMPRPFLDVRLLADPLLGTSAVIILGTLGVFNGALYLLTQQHQLVDGLSAVRTGIALLPLVAASAAGGLLGPLLHRWISQRPLIVVGLGLVAGGLLTVAALDGVGRSAGMVLLGVGAGIIMSIGANALMSAAPETRTADAGAIQETAFALGAGAGIAALGTLAIHHGADVGGGASAAVHGPGAEAALGLGAVLYALFALGAGLIILSAADGDPERIAEQEPVRKAVGEAQHHQGARRERADRRPRNAEGADVRREPVKVGGRRGSGVTSRASSR